jgi:hypothetical protein
MNQGQILPSREREWIEKDEKDEKACRQRKEETTEAQDHRKPDKYQSSCAVRA